MPKHIYTVGGTVQASGGLYIARKTDQDFLELCRTGAFAYVLTSRQMGKSSMMVHASEQLAAEGVGSVIIDLTLIGTKITADEWYLGLLTKMSDDLNLKADVIGWWQANAHLSPTQRLPLFLEKVLLSEVSSRIVVFIDEIDTTLSLPFSDDFYAALRYIYNARATVAAFQRISFVLIGVATPSDLITDPRRTPFNIGQRVDLTDFTVDEALPLTEGFDLPPDEARRVLTWVMKWTRGHPYLTQRLCSVLVEQKKDGWTEADIDRVVAETFFGEMSDQDHNLQFVRDMLTERTPDRIAVLATYQDIRLGKRPIPDDEQSIPKSHIKLSGVVRREKANLVVRNPIYFEVFNPQWIKDHWPSRASLRFRPVLTAAAAIAAFVIIGLLGFVTLSFNGRPSATQLAAAATSTQAANSQKTLDVVVPQTQTAIELVSVTRTLAPTATPTDVDLTVTNLRFLPANPAPGQVVTVAITLKNNGTTDSGSFKWAWFATAPDNNATPSIQGDVPNLAPGQQISVTGPYTFGYWGTYITTAWVNFDNAVAETNIVNNLRVQPLTTSNDPLSIDFTLLPNVTAIGDSLDLKGDEFAAWNFHVTTEAGSNTDCKTAVARIVVKDTFNVLTTGLPNNPAQCTNVPLAFTLDQPVGGASIKFSSSVDGKYTLELFDASGKSLQSGSIDAVAGQPTSLSVPPTGSGLTNVRKVKFSGPSSGAISILTLALGQPSALSAHSTP